MACLHYTFVLLTSAVSRKVYCVHHLLMHIYRCPQKLIHNTTSDQKLHRVTLFVRIKFHTHQSIFELCVCLDY